MNRPSTEPRNAGFGFRTPARGWKWAARLVPAVLACTFAGAGQAQAVYRGGLDEAVGKLVHTLVKDAESLHLMGVQGGCASWSILSVCFSPGMSIARVRVQAVPPSSRSGRLAPDVSRKRRVPPDAGVPARIDIHARTPTLPRVGGHLPPPAWPDTRAGR